MTPADFDAYTFDCYGTIIDWEKGILDALRPWADTCALGIDDESILEAFGEIEPEVESEHPALPYPDILREVHNRLGEHFGITECDTDAQALASSVGRWPPFEDSREALERLRAMGKKLIIVSNVDQTSIMKTVATLGFEFDCVVTAQDVKAYKPDPRMLEAGVHAAHTLGADRGRVMHVAQSLFHDHVPAKKIGLTTCWIDRRKGRGGGATRAPAFDITPDFTFTSLGEFADAVASASASTAP
ncbi:MAG: HAD-IA family hydrolase [Planctomycetota bacterium]|jgi:2-haloalkanoic acid dehalogenase type II